MDQLFLNFKNLVCSETLITPHAGAPSSGTPGAETPCWDTAPEHCAPVLHCAGGHCLPRNTVCQCPLRSDEPHETVHTVHQRLLGCWSRFCPYIARWQNSSAGAYRTANDSANSESVPIAPASIEWVIAFVGSHYLSVKRPYCIARVRANASANRASAISARWRILQPESYGGGFSLLVHMPPPTSRQRALRNVLRDPMCACY